MRLALRTLVRSRERAAPPAARVTRTRLRSFHHCATVHSGGTRLPTPLPLTPTPPIPPASTQLEPLPRALSPSRAILLLTIPIPPGDWPARLEMQSGLLAKTTSALKLEGIAVNMVYDGFGRATDFPLNKQDERYPARLSFPDGKVFHYPSFDLSTLWSEEFARDLAYQPDGQMATSVQLRSKSMREVYVCTHGSRDCRCGDIGGSLVLALREEVRRRGLEDQVRIGEIAHVGGHKYAANAITLPSLDMFSNLSTDHAAAIISHTTSPGQPSTLWSHWRGRYGLSSEDQASLWGRIHQESDADTKATATASHIVLRFKTWDGEVREVHASEGESLLTVAKRYDLPSMEGTCGGNLECATCHCYLAPSPPPPVPQAGDDEMDMLGYAVGYRDGESRLGCQVKVTKELGRWVEEGGVIGLPRF